MWIGEQEVNTRIGWALVEEVPFLLGRLDIFDKFDIKFLHRRKGVKTWIKKSFF